MMRTDRSGDLRSTDIGRDVAVCGWVDGRRDHLWQIPGDLILVIALVAPLPEPVKPLGNVLRLALFEEVSQSLSQKAEKRCLELWS